VIISHKHKFIFMHNRKTAGSSIVVACNPYLGPRDIQTGTWQDVLRHGGHLNAKAWRILVSRMPRMLASSAKIAFQDQKLTLSLIQDRANKTIQKYYNDRGLKPPVHPLAETVQYFYPEAWTQYFKFSVVRNPWDHAVSLYYWKLKEKGINYLAFGEFVKRVYDPDRPDPEGMRPPRTQSGWEIFTIDNKIAVDYIAHFENLANDLAHISNRIGVSLDSGIRAKSDIKDETKSTRDHYDKNTFDLVSRIYRKEIEQFGYEPAFALSRSA
jgi:hypothetical protein